MSSISSITTKGMQTLQSGMSRAGIVGKVEGADFAASVVGMRRSEIEAQAGANIVKAADATLGALIDIQA